MDSLCRKLFLAGLVDEHHRDVVDNGINPPTSCTAQAILLVGHLDWLLTGWANENLEQFLSNGHTSIVFCFLQRRSSAAPLQRCDEILLTRPTLTRVAGNPTSIVGDNRQIVRSDKRELIDRAVPGAAYFCP
jgi:hypothetical protein